VVLTVNPDVVETIQKRLREGPLTVVAVEPTFGDRMRAMYVDDAPDKCAWCWPTTRRRSRRWTRTSRCC
jgi:hypothetical protein